MNKYEKEIFDELLKVLMRMAEIESREGLIFSDEVYINLSYTLEKISGYDGVTKGILEKYKDALPKPENNSNNNN